LDDKKEGFEKREEIVAFIKYLLEEYEGNFMRQIRDYVERRFVKSKEETKKDRLDHKF
jgi:DNA-binding phage protein